MPQISLCPEAYLHGIAMSIAEDADIEKLRRGVGLGHGARSMTNSGKCQTGYRYHSVAMIFADQNPSIAYI